jgi:hypothetical protein
MTSYHISYTISYNDFSIVRKLWKEYSLTVIFSIFLILVSLVLILIRFRWTSIPAAVGGCAFLWLTVNFYKCKEEHMPFYISPLSFVILAAVIPLGIFVGVFAFKQTGLVANGVTTKQYKSIMHDKVNGYKGREYSFKEKLYNIYEFLRKPKPESSINIRL